MLSKTKSVLSVVALLATGVACQSGSTPASDTPSPAPVDTVPTGPSGPAPSAPADPSAANAAPAATPPMTDPGTQPMTEPITDPGAAETAALPADPAVGQVDPAEAQPVSGTDSDTAAAASATLSDAQIAAITEAVNRSEVEQAKLAKSRSKNAEVRRFATMMIQHHGAAEKKQAALKLETAESPLSQELGQEASSTIESLKSKQGADFDRAYLAAQIEGHQKVLDALDHDLRPQAQNPALQDYLAQLEPTVAQHLQSAHKAQEGLDKNTSTGTAKSSSAKHQSTR